MLHITHPTSNHHKHAIASEVFISVAMLAVFFIPASQASDITVDMVINLANKARAVANVAVLKKNDLLQKAAEQKAQDMIDNNYFAHVSPQGKSPWYWIAQENYDYSYAGENLAINFTSAQDEQQAWMDSPLHKKNILNSNYNETGVAVKQGKVDGHETIVVVQMFGTQMQDVLATVGQGASKDVALGQQASNVAGAQTTNTTNISKLQKISDDMKLNALFKNNAPTLIGWFSVFALAIILIIIDAFAVLHGKHKPLLIPHVKEN